MIGCLQCSRNLFRRQWFPRLWSLHQLCLPRGCLHLHKIFSHQKYHALALRGRLPKVSRLLLTKMMQHHSWEQMVMNISRLGHETSMANREMVGYMNEAGEQNVPARMRWRRRDSNKQRERSEKHVMQDSHLRNSRLSMLQAHTSPQPACRLTWDHQQQHILQFLVLSVLS